MFQQFLGFVPPVGRSWSQGWCVGTCQANAWRRHGRCNLTAWQGKRQGAHCWNGSASNFASKSFYCPLMGGKTESRTGEAHESDDALLKDCDHPWCADSREAPWLCFEMDYSLHLLFHIDLWYFVASFWYLKVWISRRMVQGEREEEDCFVFPFCRFRTKAGETRWNGEFLSCEVTQERHLDAMMEIERLKVGKSNGFCKLSIWTQPDFRKSLEALKMYEVREQVINSAESHKIQVINSLENTTLVFFVYFFHIWMHPLPFLLFHSRIRLGSWTRNNWTCQRGLCAAFHRGAFDESAIWRQSHHRADQGEIRWNLTSSNFFEEDDFCNFTDLTWKHQFNSIYNLLGFTISDRIVRPNEWRKRSIVIRTKESFSRISQHFS